MVFMHDVVDYTLNKHARVLTRTLAHEFGLDLAIWHDDVIPETEERMITRLGLLKEALTVDEQRAMLALGPLDAGRGKVFILGGAVVGQDWKPVAQ